jgi:hypothetical protein
MGSLKRDPIPSVALDIVGRASWRIDSSHIPSVYLRGWMRREEKRFHIRFSGGRFSASRYLIGVHQHQ